MDDADLLSSLSWSAWSWGVILGVTTLWEALVIGREADELDLFPATVAVIWGTRADALVVA